jgi:hypothetical protein
MIGDGVPVIEKLCERAVTGIKVRVTEPLDQFGAAQAE